MNNMVKLETTESTVPLKKFKIIGKIITVQKYIVEAETEADACDLAYDGTIKPVYEEEMSFEIDDIKEIKMEETNI